MKGKVKLQWYVVTFYDPKRQQAFPQQVQAANAQAAVDYCRQVNPGCNINAVAAYIEDWK